MEFDKKIYDFISRLGGDTTLRDGIVTVTLPSGERWNFTEPKQVDEKGRVLLETDSKQESEQLKGQAILVLAVQQGEINVVKDRYGVPRRLSFKDAVAALMEATETKTGG